jgi:hypothetical protein
MRASQRDHLVARFEDAPRTRDDLLPRFRERDLVRLPLDELHAEVALQFLELGGEGGLAHERALRGAAEMPLVRERDEVAKVLELEVSHVGSRGRTDSFCLSGS